MKEALCTFVSAEYADWLVEKTDVDARKVLTELEPEEINKLVAVISNPKPFGAPPELYLARPASADGQAFKLLTDPSDTKLSFLKSMKTAADAAAEVGS